MMTKEEIGRAMDSKFPGVYIPTTAATKLVFEDGTILVGYFEYTKESDSLQEENVYTFVEFNNAQSYRSTNDLKYITKVEGNKLKQVEYPSFRQINSLEKKITPTIEFKSIEIKSKLSITIINDLFKTLKQFEDKNEFVNLKLPKKFDSSEFGILFSFLQFVATWVRSSVSGKLLLPVGNIADAKDYLNNEFVYPVVVLSWEKPILDEVGNNIRANLKETSQEYFKNMEYFELKEKLSVPIFCFDHDKRKSGHSRHFYDSNLNLLSEDSVSNNLFPAFVKIGNFNKTVFRDSIKEKYDSFVAIIHELFANTHEHAKTDEKGHNLYPNIRSIYLKFHKKTIQSFLTTYKEFPGMQEFFKSDFQLNDLGELYLVEFSFLDSGPGLVKRFTGSSEIKTTEEQVEIIKKCLYRHNTSAQGLKSSKKGIGLDRVLQTIDGKGFVRIKSGTVDIFRNMKKLQYKHHDNPSEIKLFDTQLNTSNKFTSFPETQGTLISIFFALDYKRL